MRGKIKELRKKIEKLREADLSQKAVFIAPKPEGYVIGKFDDYEEAKKEAKRVARELNLHDATWLEELNDEVPKPPFFVVVGEFEAWIEEVED